MEIIIEKSKGSPVYTGLNKYELLQSADQDTKKRYKTVLDELHGSLCINADNDAATKFSIALASFPLSAHQRTSIELLANAIIATDAFIDPPRLRFEIGRTNDNEVYLSRTSTCGINNILVFEDGTMAHSFLAFKGSEKKDFLDFFESGNEVDLEALVFKFFAFG